jgi:hypothetical protein
MPESLHFNWNRLRGSDHHKSPNQRRKKEEMNMKARTLLLLGFVIAVGSLLVTNGKVRASDDAQFKWVIGSSASALAVDGSSITLTGTGTFAPDDPDEVTGGGTWAVSTGGSGTFQATHLIRFDLAPGSVSNPTIHAGLAFFRVAYSDGSRGILVVSCHLPGTPANVAEGAAASKGFVDYFNLQPYGAFFQQLSSEE